MRLKLTLISSGKMRIGFNYNYYVSSMLYKVLNESSSKYSQKLHEKGICVKNIKNNLLKKYYLTHKKLPEDMAFEMHFKEDDLKKYSKGKLIEFKEIFIK